MRLIGVMLAFVVLGAAWGQTPTERQEREALAAFQARDYARAESLLRRQLESDPGNYVALYNLACVRAALGDGDEAAELLQRACESGYSDLRRTRRDPNLARARASARYAAMEQRWPEVLEKQLAANLDASRAFAPGSEPVRDEALKIVYLSAFDAGSFEAARAEVSLVGEWAIENVFRGLDDAAELRLDPWVVVLLPKRPEFMRWARERHGAAAVGMAQSIGGEYDHNLKRLVAQDLGSTLRHEFMHVLHWRDMTRRGQLHAIWIMEGLCALPEDYDLDEAGNMAPGVSWRSNTAKRMLTSGALRPLREYIGLNQQQFTGTRPLGNYAVSRTLFLYLHRLGKLGEFYTAYTESYAESPSGQAALERVLGKTLEQINKDFRIWLARLPEAAEQIRSGMASLGVEIEGGAGEGPVVRMVFADAGPGAEALRRGDVITSIDGRPTRDIAELIRILGLFKPGDTVAVGYRRGREHGEASVRLVPR